MGATYSNILNTLPYPVLVVAVGPACMTRSKCCPLQHSSSKSPPFKKDRTFGSYGELKTIEGYSAKDVDRLLSYSNTMNSLQEASVEPTRSREQSADSSWQSKQV